jgi:uncharacterized protein involved in outer membrane biogenesis
MPVSRSPFRLALWTLVGLSALVSLLLLIVTLALPGWIAGRGVALASEALGRPVRIEQAHFQPWRLAVVLDGLQVDAATPGQPPLLTLARLDAALSLRSLLRGHVVIESLALDQPVLRVARLAEGRYDIDDLLQRFAPKPGAPASEDTEFAVYNIELSDGRVLIDDRPVQRRHELAQLRLALPFVSTLEADVKVQVQPQLSGRLDGVAFDSRAEALPFEDDASARLSFKLAGLDLAPLAAYLPAGLPLRLAAGRLDLDLTLDFAERTGKPPNVKLSGDLQLHELALTQPDGQPLLDLKRLRLPLTDVQPLQRRLGFGQVVLASPRAWLRPLSSPTPASAGTGAPWTLSAAGLQLSDGSFTAGEVALSAIELKVGAATWPLKQPVSMDASLRLDNATLSAQARLSPQMLEANAALQDLAVQQLAAWLPLPGSARLEAGVSGRVTLRVEKPLAAAAADRARLALRDWRIADARLTLAGRPVLTLAGARLDQAELDLGQRQLRAGTLKLDAPRAQLARDAEGRIDLLALRMPEPAEPAASVPAPGRAWALRLAGLQVERGALRWRDAAVPAGVAPVAVAVEPLNLQLGALTWPATAPVQAQLSVQLAAMGANDRPVAASAGSLRWQGRLGLAPLSAAGRLQAQALPLRLLDAYLDPAWGVQIERAELGFATELQATQQPDGAWQAALTGDMRIGPLALAQTRLIDGRRVTGEDLLSWQVLQLEGLRLALAPGAPPRLAVRDAQLDDAYARLIVDEAGRFNLRDLGPARAASAPAVAATPAASAAPPEIAIERIRVQRGAVDFNDRFVKPNFSARLTELQGSLGAFSTAAAAMAPLSVRGKVAGTGLLEIDGQLRPGSPPALDIRANASDIELAPLSTYAGKYAGHAIERGKLSARLAYQVDTSGQLVASNQIILNQLTFGARVESPDATSLPVRFALALLKDGNGVIDLNLPVSGSLNDPEFSIGGLVWKLFLNLTAKALTSPFSLFTGSDAPEQAQVAFAPGGTLLSSTDQLDRIARLLTDKPGVQLTLTGWADAESEIPALREQRLAAALKAENAATPEAALKRLYTATPLPNKPRNLLGLAQDLPPAQMRGLLMASYAVDDEALRQLAVARAVAVRDALLARGAPNARVFLGAPKLCDGACATGWRPHVELSLAAH